MTSAFTRIRTQHKIFLWCHFQTRSTTKNKLNIPGRSPCLLFILDAKDALNFTRSCLRALHIVGAEVHHRSVE